MIGVEPLRLDVQWCRRGVVMFVGHEVQARAESRRQPTAAQYDVERVAVLAWLRLADAVEQWFERRPIRQQALQAGQIYAADHEAARDLVAAAPESQAVDLSACYQEFGRMFIQLHVTAVRLNLVDQ